MVGVIGPDGVGKSTLFSLVAGARAIQSGRIEVLGGDMADARHRRRVCPRIAYMPQGLGKKMGSGMMPKAAYLAQISATRASMVMARKGSAVRLGDAWHPIRVRIPWFRDTGLPKLREETLR